MQLTLKNKENDMINIISDLIAYLIIGMLSMLHHFTLFSDSDVSNETLDAMDTMTSSNNFVARWRYKVNHMLGGSRSYEDYAAQKNQELIGCGCGCGCGFLTIIIIGLIFIFVVSTL